MLFHIISSRSISSDAPHAEISKFQHQKSENGITMAHAVFWLQNRRDLALFPSSQKTDKNRLSCPMTAHNPL